MMLSETPKKLKPSLIYMYEFDRKSTQKYKAHFIKKTQTFTICNRLLCSKESSEFDVK